MSGTALDPYAVLGVTSDVSDIELRRVYRELVKRHHPDHNGGSAESAARFAQIQNAYALIVEHRRQPAPQPQAPHARAHPDPAADPDVEERIARLEREMAAMRQEEQRRAQEQAQRARQQAQRAAAAARRANPAERELAPTPEQLGIYTTDDSFTKIIDDAAEQLGERLRKSDARKQFARRLSDLFGRDD